ncbi:MAG: hypothetical protein ACI85I_001789 [Arenicella sp.]|jgi:hypothetical protein
MISKFKISQRTQAIIAMIVVGVAIINYAYWYNQLNSNRSMTVGYAKKISGGHGTDLLIYEYEVNGIIYEEDLNFNKNYKIGKKYVVIFANKNPGRSIMLSRYQLDEDLPLGMSLTEEYDAKIGNISIGTFARDGR